MKIRLFTIGIVFVSMNMIFAGYVRADDGWIDVHFHVVGDKGEISGFEKVSKKLLKIMNKSGIDKAIIMSPPRPFQSFDIEELLVIQKKYPSRIAVMGGGGTLNPMLQKAGHSSDVSPELKQEFAFDTIPTKKYQANSTYLQISTIAYNLVHNFQQSAGLTKKRPQTRMLR